MHSRGVGLWREVFFGRTLLSFGLEIWIPTLRVRGKMNMKRAFFFSCLIRFAVIGMCIVGLGAEVGSCG